MEYEIEKVTKYRDPFSFNLWSTEIEARVYCERYLNVIKARQMWEKGHTLKEIDDKLKIFSYISVSKEKITYLESNLPKKLYDVNIDNHQFIIPHYSGDNKPIYKIGNIWDNMLLPAKISIYGNSYGKELEIDSINLDHVLIKKA